jgi:hypothetical protein
MTTTTTPAVLGIGLVTDRLLASFAFSARKLHVVALDECRLRFPVLLLLGLDDYGFVPEI